MDERVIAAMREAIALAERGVGEVEPNPPVGAVALREGKIAGRGWHRAYGDPHAEIEALAAAGGKADTIVASLEPCSTAGKTPPCTEALVRAGVRRVVFGATDPSPANGGRALAALEKAGIAVEAGVLADEAGALLARFREALARDRPWTIAKWALTLDGKIATRSGDSRWVTSEAAREAVWELRGRCEAVAVGSGTVLADDPLLTPRDRCRLASPPLRVIFDSQARTPPTARGLADRTAPTLLATTARAPAERVAALEAAGAEVARFPPDAAGRVPIPEVLRLLHLRGVRRLLLESGGALAAAFLEARALDQVVAFVAPKIVGGSGAPGPVGGEGVARMADAISLDRLRVAPVGPDLRLTGFVVE